MPPASQFTKTPSDIFRFPTSRNNSKSLISDTATAEQRYTKIKAAFVDAFNGEPEVFARAPGKSFLLPSSIDGTCLESMDWKEQAIRLGSGFAFFYSLTSLF